MENTILTAVLLPTEDASELNIDKLGILDYWKDKKKVYTNQHLYLTSDREIKEGNYTYDKKMNRVCECIEENLELITIRKPEYFSKIEFTTDPKLIADGVPKIDGNTQVILWNEGASQELLGHGKGNFLQQYCEYYNQKDNQKGVDVEKLLFDKFHHAYQDPYIRKEHIPIIANVISEHIQSNAGGFSLDDMKKCFTVAMTEGAGWEAGMPAPSFAKYIQSITKEQPKRDIIIECEMEDADYDYINTALQNKPMVKPKIKLNKDGQPILIFK